MLAGQELGACGKGRFAASMGILFLTAVALRKFRPKLAIAVEHASDRLGNARGVIQAVQRANSEFQVRV